MGFKISTGSDDAAAAEQMKEDLESAATEGSIVANVQEAANDKGVLVQGLKDMPLVMPKPTVEVTESEVEVSIQEPGPDVTQAPTPVATPVPVVSAGTFNDSGASVVSAVTVAVSLLTATFL